MHAVLVEVADEVGQEHEAPAEDADHGEVLRAAVGRHGFHEQIDALLDFRGAEQDVANVMRAHGGTISGL